MALGLLKLFSSFKSKEKEKEEEEKKEKNSDFWLANSSKEEELKKIEKDKLNIKKGR